MLNISLAPCVGHGPDPESPGDDQNDAAAGIRTADGLRPAEEDGRSRRVAGRGSGGTLRPTPRRLGIPLRQTHHPGIQTQVAPAPLQAGFHYENRSNAEVRV